MARRNARLPMDKELSKLDGNWRHRNTHTTREDQCKVTAGTYTPPMMCPESTGAPLHFQRKLKPYQPNPKWVRDKEGCYRKAHAPNVTNVDATDIRVSATETIRPKIHCRFCNTEGHLKETAKSSRHSKTGRKRSPNPLMPPKHASNAQRRKHLASKCKSA